MKAAGFKGAWRGAAVFAALLCSASSGLAQLNQNCTVSVLNRTVSVNADGSWVLPNIPANFGQVKARATCTQNGVTTFGESDFFTVTANDAVNLPQITLGATTPIPVSLAIANVQALTTVGQTAQLAIKATYPDGSMKDVTAASTGTNYTVSNPAIATLSADGLITAVSSGNVIIQANNDGATGISTVSVNVGGANVGGIPVSWLMQYGLNPNDALIAMEDADRDGLTNLQEYQAGTNPILADTDGDGINDGDEVNKYKTNPLIADTDGDKIPDGVEVQTGTNPLDAKSYDLKKATASSVVTPTSFQLITNSLLPSASVQLQWTITLIDGKTTLNLISDARTKFASSNPLVCSLNPQAGLIMAGNPGSCVITMSQSTLSLNVPGNIQAFTPTALSFVAIPGFANNVKVSGGYAYVAAGSAGLQIVDVSNPSNPRIAASLYVSANANNLRIAGNLLYLATSTGFTTYDITNPLVPQVLGSVRLPSQVWDLAISGSYVFVADDQSGLQVIDISNNSAPVVVGSLAIPKGIAKGVAVSGNYAVVAAGVSAGVVIIDITSPSAPKILGGVITDGDPRKVAIQGNSIFVAQFTLDTSHVATEQVVDFTNPNAPSIIATTPVTLGGKLQDIALSTIASHTFTLGADVYFVNGVPIVDVTAPHNPVSSTILNFSSYRDDNGHGIAVDNQYVYLTGEEGTVTDLGVSGNTRLYIGQYQQITDNFGIAPSVSITSPTNGAALIQGQTITVSANATDDVAVASVNFLVQGQSVFTASAAPFQFQYTVPETATMLMFSATATDYGGNVGAAPNVQMNVIPDPLTTVTGRVVDADRTPVGGASVNIPTFQVSPTSTTNADGSFSLSGVSTISGNIQILAKLLNAAGATLAGFSKSVGPVPSSAVDVGTITLLPIPIISKLTPKSALEGSQVSIQVTGSTLAGASWTLQPAPSTPIALQVLSVGQDGTSATLSVAAPNGVVGTFALVASNAAGDSGSTLNRLNRFTIVDPNSTADTDRDGFQDVIEAVFGTDPLDANSFPVIPTAPEAESTQFSVLNAPVTGAGIQESESGAFSVLNAPVNGSGIRETESFAFSVLNVPVSSSGVQEVESTPFSLVNAPTGTSAFFEADAYFSVCNGPTCPRASSVSSQVTALKVVSPQSAAATNNTQTDGSSAVDPLADSDGDGLPDWFEVLIGTDAHEADTDGDGLSDFDEVAVYGTNPLDSDTDGDGFSDGEEILLGSDPLNAASTPLKPVAQTVANASRIKNYSMQGETNDKTRSRKIKSEAKATRTIVTDIKLPGSERGRYAHRTDPAIQ